MTNYDILKEYEAHQTPVPSYDEWRTLKLIYEYCPTREKYIMKLEIKNAQLKELLKEVLRHELSLKEISELSRKISEALK